jgi:hypothetical protein
MFVSFVIGRAGGGNRAKIADWVRIADYPDATAASWLPANQITMGYGASQFLRARQTRVATVAGAGCGVREIPAQKSLGIGESLSIGPLTAADR